MKQRSSDDIRDRIAERVVRSMGPIFAVMALVVCAALNLLYPGDLRRQVAVVVALSLLTVCGILARRERWRAAANALLLSLSLAVLAGMTLNGGPLATEYWGMLPATAMVGWLYGARAAVACTVGAVIFAILTGWLIQLGILPPSHPPHVGLTVLAASVSTVMTLALGVLPFSMAREALEESKRVHTALLDARENERRTHLAFDAVFDQTYELVGVLDPEGRIVRANATSLAMIGAEERDVLGKPFWETPWWADAEDRARLRRAIEQAAGGERVRFQTKHFDKEGSRRIIDFSLGPYFDGSGEVVYLIPEGRDITELVEAQTRLTHAQKMDAVGQLAGGVAHDFNNLLTGILGSAELLALETRGEPATSRRRVMVETILRAGQRAADLTAQLLAFGRRGTPYMEAMHLNESVQSTASLLERTLGPSVRIVCSLSEEDPMIFGDATGIENALINLAINARDAMPDGGTLTFRTALVELDAAVCAASGLEIAPGKMAQVSIEDTGSGIAPDDRARIFEPFFTTKADGTGLGLPAVFGAVASHEGAIRVDSEPGRGTKFHLYFPAAEGAHAAPTVEAVDDIAFTGFRILMADDDPIARATTEAHLEQLGFEVWVTEDGDAALERFRSDPHAFEAILLDVIMPGMHGPAVAREALRIRPDLPVILMSGFPREEDLSILSECRGRFLRKPFTRMDLLAALSFLMEAPEPEIAMEQLS